MSWHGLEKHILWRHHQEDGRPGDPGDGCGFVRYRGAARWRRFWPRSISGLQSSGWALITAFGPSEIVAGEKFNTQPDGVSGLWVKLGVPAGKNSQIVFGGA